MVLLTVVKSAKASFVVQTPAPAAGRTVLSWWSSWLGCLLGWYSKSDASYSPSPWHQVLVARLVLTVLVALTGHFVVMQWRRRRATKTTESSSSHTNTSTASTVNLHHENHPSLSNIQQQRQAFLDRLQQQQQHLQQLQQEQEEPQLHSIQQKPEPEQFIQKNASKQKVVTLSKTKHSPPTKKASSQPVSVPSLLSLSSSSSHSYSGWAAFQDWYSVEASLYRMYHINENIAEDYVALPFVPHSRRGTVNIFLQVTNRLAHDDVEVFWVEYSGREVSRGTMRPGQTWTQTTWIDHPWVFRRRRQQEQQHSPSNPAPSSSLLLHYVPYRVIPTTRQVSTICPDDPRTGMHQFSIEDASPTANTTTAWVSCRVVDPVLPHPGFDTPSTALEWVLVHMTRTGYSLDSWHVLVQYVSNLRQSQSHLRQQQNTATTATTTNDDNNSSLQKYRCIRISHSLFYSHVWNTAARGIFLCAFASTQILGGGSHLYVAEPTEREITTCLQKLQQWKQQLEDE